MILKLVLNGPKWSPPHPRPWRQQKSPARGGNKLEKNTFLMTFYDFYEKSQNNILPGGLKRDPREKYNRRFPAGVQKEEI